MAMESPDFLAATRTGYDLTAAAYAERFHGHLDDKPVDRAMLGAFAEMVAATGNKRVIDVGCGTGATTRILRDHGADPFGVDLSPHMVDLASTLNPDLDFSVASMTDLVDVSDACLGGVCAWYSIIHIPDEHLDGVLQEFFRVLVDGGMALLAFQVGDHPRVLTEAFGRQVDLTFHRRMPEAMTRRLDTAGLRPCAQLVREPDDGGVESTQQAYLIVRK